MGPEFADLEAVMQTIRLELYRENVGGALELAQAGYEIGSFFAAVTKPGA